MVENLKERERERDNFGDLDTNGRIILKSLKDKTSVDWIHLAQERERDQ